MRILVTGSAGHLGEALVRTLRAAGTDVVGLDLLASPHTDVIASVADRGAVRAALVASLKRIWEETLCWFGPNDDPAMIQLQQEGVIDATPDELRSRFLRKIMPVLNELEIDVPVAFDATTKQWQPAQSLPWSEWDAQGRRLDKSHV